jgi:hypothetical protein
MRCEKILKKEKTSETIKKKKKGGKKIFGRDNGRKKDVGIKFRKIAL